MSVDVGSSSRPKPVSQVLPRNKSWKPRPECCICRIPQRIRKVRQDAYTPQVISIGPFHYGKKNLRDMENLKKRLVSKFFERTTDEKRKEVLAFIRAQEQKIPNSYAGPCKLGSPEYTEMILHDAIFII